MIQVLTSTHILTISNVLTLSAAHPLQQFIVWGLGIVAVIMGVLIIALLRERRNWKNEREKWEEERENWKHERKKWEEEREMWKGERKGWEVERTTAQGLVALENTRVQKYMAHQLSEEQTERIYGKICQAMNDTSLICDSNFSLHQLADAIDERQRDVSQVINSRLGVNFHTMLGDYRVQEACRRINQTQAYETLTIEALAESVGILSRSNFAIAFKRVTGLNPSEYIRIAKSKRADALSQEAIS